MNHNHINEKMFTKQTDTQSNINEHSFRTFKTYTNYNLSDFLPSSQSTAQSRTFMTFSRPKERNATQPNDRVPKEHQFNELKRRVELLQEERNMLKSQHTKLIQILQGKDQEVAKLITNSSERQKLIDELRKQKQLKPRLTMMSNAIQFQLYPKLKQCYEVSVQTEPIIQTVISNVSIVKPQNVKTNFADKEMQNIYERLQSLKMGKKSNKLETLKPSSQLISVNPKTQRNRPAMPYQWSNWQDKQNNMRTSNLQEINLRPSQSNYRMDRQKIREQTIDIYAIQDKQLQRILGAYFG